MPLEQNFVAVDRSLHDLKGIDCGKPSLNEFLSRHAAKHSKLGLSRTYVLTEISESPKKSIAAYFTLASATVARDKLPTKQSLPSYPVPAVMLARLAVSRCQQGCGFGAKTLVYALRQAANLSSAGLPAYGLILDVLDGDALQFYQHFAMFEPFTDDPMRLFVSMKTLLKV
ncbi:MAG: hypothetical protein ACI89D_002473 [Bermanella sp.]